MGSVLFVYFKVNNPEVNSSQKFIVLTETMDRQLQHTFYTQWGRNPNKNELQLLRDQMFFENVLLEEALNLDLHKQDPEITKRLVKQMEDIMSAAPNSVEPSEEILRQYYLKHLGDYSKRIMMDFITIDVRHLSDIQKVRFEKLLGHIGKIPTDTSLFNHKRHKNVTIEMLEKEFGRHFSKKLQRIKVQTWHGPIVSKSREYYVYITDTNNSKSLEFDEVIDRVYVDYLREEKEKRLKQNYQKSLYKYKFEQP